MGSCLLLFELAQISGMNHARSMMQVTTVGIQVSGFRAAACIM